MTADGARNTERLAQLLEIMGIMTRHGMMLTNNEIQVNMEYNGVPEPDGDTAAGPEEEEEYAEVEPDTVESTEEVLLPVEEEVAVYDSTDVE